MRYLPTLYWFLIFHWIFVGAFRHALIDIVESITNNIKHFPTTRLRRKSILHHNYNNENSLINVVTPSMESLQQQEAPQSLPNPLTTSQTTFPTFSSAKHFFISPNYTVVEAQTLTTAVLHCEITDWGNSTVTWKRRRDYKILTFGLLTYSSDIRFFTRNMRSGRDWSLHIRYANTADAGLYECQISSHPPSSIFVELQILEAHAEVLGGPDKVVQAGSTLLLTCIVRRCTEIPEYIFWYHEERMINYDHHVVTASNHHHYLQKRSALNAKLKWQLSEFPHRQKRQERTFDEKMMLWENSLFDVTMVSGMGRHHRQSSELLIANASERHSGNYSCVPSKARPSSVTVHVLSVEKPAAMQHNKNQSPRFPPNILFLLIILSANFLR